MDETEKYIEHGSDLHALLNEGHCTGGTVLRVLGEKQELREFSVFGAVAFAANGRLADDLEQRSIVIEMQRRRADEGVSELREDRCEHLTNLARMCARWADDSSGDVAGRDPDMAGLINRDADNWRPLFAIADLVGSDWPSRAREAALALTPKDSESIGPMLLGDIKTTFDDRSVDRLSSAEICTVLCEMEGKPWADWKGKSLTTNQLARLLKPFNIVGNKTVRVGTKTAKGYYRHEFEAAWERYLTHEGAQGAQQPSQGNKANEMGISCAFQTVTRKTDVTVENAANSLNGNGCDDVTVVNGYKTGPGVGVGRKCAQCGKHGAELEAFYGEASAWLHRGACQADWMGTQDDLTIPSYLDRRAEASVQWAIAQPHLSDAESSKISSARRSTGHLIGFQDAPALGWGGPVISRFDRH